MIDMPVLWNAVAFMFVLLVGGAGAEMKPQ